MSDNGNGMRQHRSASLLRARQMSHVKDICSCKSTGHTVLPYEPESARI